MTTVPETGPAAIRELVEREAARELGSSFRGVLGAVRRLRSRETHDAHGLSDAQYTLVFALMEHEELSTGELASLASLSPATATQLLDGLEAAGLVNRQRSPKDRRVVLTSLSDRGLALVHERHRRFAPRWNAALAPFSDEELRTAAAVLNGMRAVFDAA